MNFLKKILQKIIINKNQRDIKRISKYLDSINHIYANIASLSNDALRNKTKIFQSIIQESIKELIKELKVLNSKVSNISDLHLREKIFLDIKNVKQAIYNNEQKILLEILPEAFAVVKETAKRFSQNTELLVKATELDRHLILQNKSYIRPYGKDMVIWKNNWNVIGNNILWNMVHYDVQLLGGIVLHEGKIAEMATGEGKTLVATLPIYLNALTGKGVHVITVNDYLSKRDTIWMGPIMEFLGLSVDCIDNYLPNTIHRRKAYLSDITYGTNSEFGFDYLRDNISHTSEDIVQRELNYAIIDEVDSVLIDEARTPLIISGPVPQDDTELFHSLNLKVKLIVIKQKIYLNKLLKEAKANINYGNKKQGGFQLLQVYRGLPKYKSLIKFLSEENIRAILQNIENFYAQDNQREMYKVDKDLFFVINEKNNTVELTDKGIKFLSDQVYDNDFFILPDIATEIANLENENLSYNIEKSKKEELLHIFSIKSKRLHIIHQLLKAYVLFEKDIDYVVLGGKVKIVDEQTGRIMDGRRYSDGLHQALEAKENVHIEPSNQTLATITLQNYFRMYNKLSGMTGTAETESEEFWQIYKLDVIVIPPHQPIIRKDYQDLVYKTVQEKYNSIIKEIIFLSQEKKRPVLVGTTSVGVSELLSRMLKIKKISHNVLNAKLHQKEADIIAAAGLSGMVTIATNMAGRGTDIKLSKIVKNYGGLAIIGTERHDSRRIDRQLRGRAGRQGDPGSSQFYVSLEDTLMRLFIGSNRLANLMDRFGHKEGEAIQHILVSRSIERAQKKVEENNFGIRKRLLEYDDVMNKQRNVIYNIRKNALIGINSNIDICLMLYNTLKHLIISSKNIKNIKNELMKYFNFYYDVHVDDALLDKKNIPIIIDQFYAIAIKNYEFKRKYIISKFLPIVKNVILKNNYNNFDTINIPFLSGDKTIMIVSSLKKIYESNCQALVNDLEKFTILSFIDDKWKEHLKEMDNLRHSVQHAIYEQKDPLLVYKEEAFNMFSTIINQINKNIILFLFNCDLPDGIEKYYFDKQHKYYARNDKIIIRNKITGMIKEIKFKYIDNFIKSGIWIIDK